MDFAALIAPLSEEAFLRDHWGRRPVHIPAPEGSNRGGVIGWERLNDLLTLRSHWSAPNIDLIMNSRPVAREHYMEEAATLGGPVRLADPARVDLFLGMGASLVANAVEEISPEVRALTDMLAERFAGIAAANLYCSFRDVQAFGSHYDAHEVFALHCAGEKVWRIYENRADAPLEPPPDTEGAQARIDAAKGKVMMEALMRPGDLLYIPRGFFHDALASSGESLHLTLSVAPHSGRLLFRLLEQAALAEPAFRAYLPDAREAQGDALRDRLDALAGRMAKIVRSPAFAAEIANHQRKLVRRGHRPSLPSRPPVEAYARTDREAAVVRRDAGAMLRAGGGEHPLGLLAEEMEWLLGRPAFTAQELAARHPHRSVEEIRRLVDLVTRLQLFVRYHPKV